MATESRPAAPDYFALCLLAFALLNLNGVAFFTADSTAAMAHGGSQAFSTFFALPLTLYLIARYARISNMGDIFGLFLLFFALFLFSSAVPSLVAQNIQDAEVFFLRRYAVTVIFTSAVYFWAATLSDAALVNVLRIAKGMLLIACFATIFTEQLTGIFHYQFDPERGIERGLGFFANPNEAAAAALYCFALVVAYPARSRLLTLAQGSIALAALIMTFSRTGFLTMLLLCPLFLFLRPSIKAVALSLISIILLISALWWVFEYDLFNLATEQRRRLASILSIVTGQTAEQAWGSRPELIGFGIRKIAEVFPWGAGISEFHHMEYGHRGIHSGVWLGVHNTYLMILGEAGLPAFVAFLAFWASIIRKLVNSPFRVFAMGATVIFLCDMTTSHNILLQRLPGVMLAFIMVSAARSPRSLQTFFAPGTVPGGSQA